MSVRTVCAHLFGFAVLLAALLVLPQAVQAHAGHAHAMHAPVQDDVPAADVPTPAEPAVEQQIERSLTAAVPDTSGHAHDSPCDRGCCAQGSCACCFSVVAPMPLLLLPPTLSTPIGLVSNPGRPGIDGTSLRRPPRFFA